MNPLLQAIILLIFFTIGLVVGAHITHPDGELFEYYCEIKYPKE